MPPLTNLLVLDFSTLLPGPLASLMLAEAGATVINIERPGSGDEMRSYQPRLAGSSINFHMLNRGKHSLTLNLKDSEDRARLDPLLEKADIILEQFRPGVMSRLGLGFEDIMAKYPGIIYCSLTGWGQSGPKAGKASHDLNFMAESGLLGLSVGSDGKPGLPPVLAADIAGGTYPAVINILLALMRRQRTGEGAYLDLSMADSLYTFAYETLGEGLGLAKWPEGKGGLTTGGTPRYQIYRTSDDRFIAAAPLEQQFWLNFCRIIGLPDELRDADQAQAETTTNAIESLIVLRTASEWMAAFEGEDVCCSLIEDLQTAVSHPQNKHTGLFDRTLTADGVNIPVLPLPIAPVFRSKHAMRPAPALGSYEGGDADAIGPSRHSHPADDPRHSLKAERGMPT